MALNTTEQSNLEALRKSLGDPNAQLSNPSDRTPQPGSYYPRIPSPTPSSTPGISPVPTNPAPVTPTLTLPETPTGYEDARKRLYDVSVETPEQIRKRMLDEQESRLKGIDAIYNTRVEQERELGNRNLGRTRSINALTGMGGSPVAETRASNTEKDTQKRIDYVNQLRQAEISAIFDKIDANVMKEKELQLSRSKENSERILSEVASNALSALNSFAAQGVKWDDLEKTNKDTLDTLVKQSGKSAFELRELYNKSLPQAQKPEKIFSGWQGNNFVMIERTPDGKITTQSYDSEDLGIPKGSDVETVTLGDSVYWVDKNDRFNADGTPKLVKVGKKEMNPLDEKLKQAQVDKIYADIRKDSNPAQPGDNPQLYSGLSNPTATAVRAKVNAFKSEPVAQNFATVQEGRNFAKSISDTTKNPADDQALIYALAKALDPGSVVREGEYATAQKYSQSWINAYGKGVEQALLGTGFLSADARKNIKKTIEQKYSASKKSYDNLYGQYENGISTLTGRKDGSKFLSDYRIAEDSSGGEVTLKDPKTGEVKKFQGMSAQDLKEAMDNGFIKVF